jgi:hypothetical protein
VTAEVMRILPQDGRTYLTDFEMLFDPRYDIDVLRLFRDMSRRCKLIVRWCGGVDGDTLVYAEQGCRDYARYNPGDYKIACVK